MEHKVINNLRCVSGDKSLFGQWHLRVVTALGQYGQVHDEIVQHLVKEIDLGKDLDKVVEELKLMHGGESKWFTKEMESLAQAICQVNFRHLPRWEGHRVYVLPSPVLGML